MVLIVIPAYNEAKTIGRVLRDLFEHNWRNILVVSDGSVDDTDNLARAAGADVVRHALNRGQGAALETGNEYARRHGFDTVVHFDGDNQHDAADIALALQMLTERNLDAVLGSRFMDNRSKIPWLKRYIILPLSRWVNFVFTGVLLSDAHNGFRVLTRSALHTIRITQDGMAHNSEIVAELKAGGFQFAEVPVHVMYHEFGQGFMSGFKIIWDLLQH